MCIESIIQELRQMFADIIQIKLHLKLDFPVDDDRVKWSKVSCWKSICDHLMMILQWEDHSSIMHSFIIMIGNLYPPSIQAFIYRHYCCLMNPKALFILVCSFFASTMLLLLMIIKCRQKWWIHRKQGIASMINLWGKKSSLESIASEDFASHVHCQFNS